MSQTKKSRIKKWIVIPSSLVVLLIALIFVLLGVGRNFADDILGELVERQTRGYYSLAFDNLKLHALDRKISVENLYLKADSSKITQATGLTTLYDVRLEELVINFKSLYKFYFQKQLEIETMRIIDPEIRLQRVGDSETTSFSFETGNMYKAISDYLTVLKVDYFRIQDGDFNTEQFSLDNIDFQVENLLLDSVARNDVFYSETIFLEIKNQKFFLPDSIHEISFERFVLSTADSILRFENFAVHPTLESGVSFDSLNEFNVYDIFIPSLSLKGIDYQSAYRKDHLIIEELTFAQPRVFVEDETHGKQEKKADDNSLLNLLFTVFHKIDIGKLAIEESEIDLKINTDETKQRLRSKETNLAFYNISLDTNNYRFDKRIKYFDHVEISINNYEYLLPDSIHQVQFESLGISSRDSILQFTGLNISNQNAPSDKASITLGIPRLEINGLDYLGLINRKLQANDFTVENLTMNLEGARSDTSGMSSFSIDQMHQALQPFFKEVSLENAQIEISRLDVFKKLLIGGADVKISGLTINESTNSFQDLFDESSIQLQDIRFDQDSIQLKGKGVNISQDLTAIKLADWDIGVQTEKVGLNAVFTSLTLEDLNPDSLLSGDFTTFTKAILESPEINIERLQSGKPSSTPKLGIEKEIIVTDGKIAIALDSLILNIADIDVDFYLGDSTAIHSLAANEVDIDFINRNHHLALKDWSYDTISDEMYFKEVAIYPINQADSLRSLINGEVKMITLRGFAQQHLFGEKKLITEELLITKPRISGHLVKEQKKRESSSDFQAQVDLLLIDSGELKLSGLGKGVEGLTINDIGTVFHGLNYPHSNSLFYSDSLIIKSESLAPSLTSGDQLYTGAFAYSTTDSQLSIDSIYYQKKDKSVSALLPRFNANKIDMDLLMDHGLIKAGELGLVNPQIRIIANDEKKTDPREKIRLPIELAKASIDDLLLQYVDSSNQKEYLLDSIDISLLGFTMKDTLTLLGMIKGTEDFSISGEALAIPINEFYSFGSGSYQYSASDERLMVEDARLIPLYSKSVYSSKIEKQSDWFDVNISSIDMTGLSAQKVLSDSMVAIRNLLLDGTDLYVYRDKRIPFPEDQIGYLPQEQIQSIPFPIAIDTIIYIGGVTYEEHPEDFESTGILSFDNMDAQITHLTNVHQQNETMQLRAKGQIIQEGEFNVHVVFELGRPDNRFSFEGSVRDLPLDSLNQMLGPIARVNIKSGYAEEIDFQFTSNDTLAVGDMVFLYKNLKLKVLDAKKHETNLGSGLMSFFANTFVIRNKNPRFLFPRKGTVYFKRDTSKAVFNYWGKSILTGAVSSVGIHKSDKAAKRDQKQQKKLQTD